MNTDLSGILLNSLWAGLSGTALAVLLTAPSAYLAATFCCAFAGRLVRDVLTASGAGPNWSIALAAAVVVLVAVAVIRRHRASPVVLICGVLPLGAAGAMFNMIFELMKLFADSPPRMNLSSLSKSVCRSLELTTRQHSSLVRGRP